jgi:hypothetical protein
MEDEVMEIENAQSESLIEEVDVEECSKRGERPPHAKRYRIRIDKLHFVVEKRKITGLELLELVGLTPPQYSVYLHVREHQPRRIAPNEHVDLTAECVERFSTMKCNLTDGAVIVEGSRQFRLPEPDERFLEALGRPYDTILDGGSRWLIVQDVDVPVGYNLSRVSLAFAIPATYPDTQIDMAYVSPALVRADGKAIPALCNQAIRGQNWQRWSRHRTADNPWRPGIDDISTHLNFVNSWLCRELERE